jgi:hypothetical protein
MTPDFDEVNGASNVSVSGSASMSARQAIVRPDDAGAAEAGPDLELGGV